MEKDHEETGGNPITESSAEEPEMKLHYFRGVPFPPFHAGIVEEVVEFKPEPTDIFVVTYPKCGTTWTQFIVWEILHEGAPPPSPNKMVAVYFPHLEMVGTDKVKELTRPRLMKTHLPFQLQPYHPSAKYIYVVRNPWDCCVSYYHHLQVGLGGLKKPPFDKYFDHFLQGKVPLGDFFDHVLSWYAHKNDANVLILSYEDMSADPKAAILKVAKFLGHKYYEVLMSEEEVLNNCLKHTEFKYMKDLGIFLPKNLGTHDESKPPDKKAIKAMMETMSSVDRDNVDLEKFMEWNFFRKGKVGDWENHFTDDHFRRFTDYVKSKTTGTELENMWSQPPEI